MPFCAGCEAGLERHRPGCALCGLSGAHDPCDACAVTPPPFDGVHAVWSYGGPIADVVHRFKYRDHPELARPLGRAMAALELPSADLVVPVPLHASRRRERTFDQAFHLAREIGQARGWVVDRALIRTRATARQVGQDKDARLSNVSDAFEVRIDVKGRSVLLVDDVVTTGATAGECASVLKKAGASRVAVACVARA